MDFDATIEAYWTYWRYRWSGVPEERNSSDGYFWAWEAVEEVIDNADPRTVSLIVALANAAPNDLALAYLGAGPLESLLNEHAAKFADEIDEAARTHEGFCKALRCAWYDNHIDPELVARFRRFGPPY